MPTPLCGSFSLDDGQVIAFDAMTGLLFAVLYTNLHGAFISGLAINHRGIMASGNIDCVVQVWNLKQTFPGSLVRIFSNKT